MKMNANRASRHKNTIILPEDTLKVLIPAAIAVFAYTLVYFFEWGYLAAFDVSTTHIVMSTDLFFNSLSMVLLPFVFTLSASFMLVLLWDARKHDHVNPKPGMLKIIGMNLLLIIAITAVLIGGLNLTAATFQIRQLTPLTPIIAGVIVYFAGRSFYTDLDSTLRKQAIIIFLLLLIPTTYGTGFLAADTENTQNFDSIVCNNKEYIFIRTYGDYELYLDVTPKKEEERQLGKLLRKHVPSGSYQVMKRNNKDTTLRSSFDFAEKNCT